MGRAAFFNPDEMVIYLAGIQVQGFAVDSQVKVEQVSDAFNDDVGVDGEVLRIRTNDRRVKVTVSLIQSSQSNARLSALHQSDLNAPNGQGVGAFLLQDLSGFSVVKGAQAWIKKYPDAEYKRTASGREWEIIVATGDRFEGGN